MTAADWTFMVGLSLFVLHELDAVQQQEWRFFFSWTGMSDTAAYRWFVAAHLPLMLGLLVSLSVPAVQYGLAGFLIFHAILHTLMRNHPLIHFNSLFSRVWIYGGALFGILFLLMAISNS